MFRVTASLRSIVLLTCALLLPLTMLGLGCDEDAPPETDKPEKADPPPKQDTAPSGPSEKAIEDAEDRAVGLAVSRFDRAQFISSNLEAAQEEDEPSRPTPRKTTGSLEPKQLREVFGQHNSAMQSCYERELKKDSNLEGTVELSLTIATNGSVRRTRVTGGDLRNDQVHECLKENARQWTFPEPEGGAAKVRKPYSFAPNR